MFLTLNHQKLDVYRLSLQFVKECYQLAKYLPAEEKFGLINQIRRAALSVHLNIAEGSSGRWIVERKGYYEIARGSVIEINAALDIADHLQYLEKLELTKLSESMVKCFRVLTGSIR